MRLVLTPVSAGLFRQGLRGALFAAGISLLAYCAYVSADRWAFQQLESTHFEQLLANAETPAAVTGKAHSDIIGRLEIPRLGVSAVILEGTSAKVLRRAVGHIPGTALPGHPGNVGLSGHRDTFFRALENLHDRDLITVTTTRGAFRYKVVSTTVVHPTDTAVLNATPQEVLTLVTCYPFAFMGSAPERYIVRATRLL